MLVRASLAVVLVAILAAGAPARGADLPKARSSALLTLPLARRCELARLVALQAAEMIHETRRSDAYLAGGRGGLLVWVGEPEGRLVHGDPGAEAQKLIRADEVCAPVLSPYGDAGGSRIEIVGSGMPGRAGRFGQCLAFVAEDRGGLVALVMRFNRSESCGAPSPPSDGGVTMTHGRAMIMASLPQLEIDVDTTKEQLRVARAAITFPKHSGPVP